MTVPSVPLNQYDNERRYFSLPSGRGPANLPVLNPTASYWITSDSNPLAKEGSEGPLTIDADICIIGSGITGVSAAYHLSKLTKSGAGSRAVPLKVVVLEARDFCSGATGRNGGHLTPSAFFEYRRFSETYGSDQAARSFALEKHTATEIVEILQTNQLSEAVDLVEGGHIDLAFTDAEFQSAEADFKAAQEGGVDVSRVQWYSEEHMKATYGVSYPACWSPGYNLWPLKLVTQLYILAKKASPHFTLSLHTQTPVTSIVAIAPSVTDKSPHIRRWSLTTPRGSISCSYVVHATNGYASHLLPHMHGPAGIIPTRGQIIAIRAAVPVPALGTSSWGANEGFEYWFPRPVTSYDITPLVILGGGREVSETFELYEDDDSVIKQDVGEALRNFLPGAFPGKYESGREPEQEWSGIMGFTALRDPFVGPVVDKSKTRNAFEGQYIAAGYSGHGMPRAFACAEVVAQQIAAELTGNTWAAPEWLPKRYLTWNRDIEGS